MSASIVVRHNFETAHRLPFLHGKCENLHGHSWWAEVTITGRPDPDGVLLDFGQVKARLREWIDGNLDHGVMLGVADPLVDALADHGRVYVFDPVVAGSLCSDRWGPGARPLAWPTVENVAELIRRWTVRYLRTTVPSAATLAVSVRVTETHVNAAVAS